MKQLTESGLTEEVVRPFARVMAHSITQDELQKLGVKVTEENQSSFITWWVGHTRL